MNEIDTFVPIIKEANMNLITGELNNIEPMYYDTAHSAFESIEERIIRKEFGGIPKEEIIEILKRERPEMFI